MITYALLSGLILSIILFFIYERNTTQEVKACKETIESQHALIQVLAKKVKKLEKS